MTNKCDKHWVREAVTLQVAQCWSWDSQTTDEKMFSEAIHDSILMKKHLFQLRDYTLAMINKYISGLN